MKKILVILLILSSTVAVSQNIVCSWNGVSMNPHEGFRSLNIFVNIIYDMHPEKISKFPHSDIWDTVSKEGINEKVPSYLLDLMDTTYLPGCTHGTITRLYGESSFDELQIVGDFMIVNIKESSILSNGAFTTANIVKSAVKYVNEHGGLQTIYGHDDISHYCKDGKTVFFTQFFIRNITKEYGGINSSTGYGSSFVGRDSLLIGDTYYHFTNHGSVQCVGSEDISLNPSGIVEHEMSHSLFGGNSFHTSGGNHRGTSEYMPFLGLQGGHGLMGASGSGLVSCNAYERWRMHWRHRSNDNENDWWIVARDTLDNIVSSDISRESGAKSFILRDFVTYGDAIRIKLPYKDSDKASNQYIWIENHQVGRNGRQEFLQHANINSCRPQEVAGVYAYYQVGRDVLRGKNGEVYFSDERDNLRVIPAEGYWDYDIHYLDSTYHLGCVSWNEYNYVISREKPNPFSGNHDQETMFFPTSDCNVLNQSYERTIMRKNIDGVDIDSLVFNGDARDMFVGRHNLNLGTNPSTCNLKTCYNSMTASRTEYKRRVDRNNLTTYLSGLGIEIIELNDGTYRVDIRWDDFEIENDARWTGNISLKEKAVLGENFTLILSQNKTVSQFERDSISGFFAPLTIMTCGENSEMMQNAQSVVRITDGSRLVVEKGAIYSLCDKSVLQIEKKSSIELNGDLYLGDNARFVVKSRADICGCGTIHVKQNSILKIKSKLLENFKIVRE